MKSEQIKWSEGKGWSAHDASLASSRDLVLVFFDNLVCRTSSWFDEIRTLYPNAIIAGCSTSGSISGTMISDNDAVATAIAFEKSKVRYASGVATDTVDMETLGSSLGKELMDDDLRHIFILSDGLSINGSDLARGVAKILPEGINITGGMAGDGTRFGETYVIANRPAVTNAVVMIGFYGESLRSKSGCFAGWEEFGPERIITRSSGNVLYEIDGKPALELYKSYLGEFAADLPRSGLRFPISIRPDKESAPVIRTLLGIDEEDQSLTFAGDTPKGELCRLMKTNMDLLIEHAGMAARESYIEQEGEFLVLMVSCVGRRLVLGQLCEEELEIARESLGENAVMCGFYSYGELSALGESRCSLHNQTMTLVSIYE
jgi:hypothetical protein